MGGINSLSGLNNVSVDFRPAIGPNVQGTGNANEPKPGVDAVPENVPQAKAEVKSVVQKLDVLLLGAAGKSVSADAAANIKATPATALRKNRMAPLTTALLPPTCTSRSCPAKTRSTCRGWSPRS